MKNLNNYITEAWSSVKKHTNNAEIEAWCDEMGIKNYTINTKGEINVNGNVNLYNKKDLKELPYKFGKVTGFFSLTHNLSLTSLKNCPDYVGEWFACDKCPNLDSLEGCPKEVGGLFYCRNCKREFPKKKVISLCNVKKTNIHV